MRLGVRWFDNGGLVGGRERIGRPLQGQQRKRSQAANPRNRGLRSEQLLAGCERDLWLRQRQQCVNASAARARQLRCVTNGEIKSGQGIRRSPKR